MEVSVFSVCLIETRPICICSIYIGWQVIDATPQEPSDGRYRLGPAPLTAIRKGQLDIPYDTRFIFTETCAQVCHFIEDEKNTNGYLKTCTIKYM